ncbi:MAG: bifunctional aspartate kinase/homoserine dehydrogenase I, partial [Prevotellamassilia sp.]|nr:bifunctional aspartate kinase/homoserine dehydrogenase I [Prevotellamassilia sp.]
DSRTLFKTTRQGDKHLVDYDLTNKNILDNFAHHQGIAVMGGFIATDAATGATTNLGRGGSDFTAAILAAALDAEVLEIWTDVDGFMTADPRVISTAYTIDELTYGEAMELCNFGAKVVYPPTIYPVCVKNIPILIKNTLNPTAKGSIIHAKAESSKSPIRGISSVNEMSLVTVSGLSMVGVVGVNRRIFATLAKGGISVFMVAQTSSETSTSLCVTTQDAEKACQLLDKEFEKEIQDGAMHHTSKQDGLATVAVVGERMKQHSGTAGKLFTVLGKNGISICAMSQGALEMNISFVVEKHQLRKALNVLHDSFFLSQHEELNVFLCGTGTVGGSLLQQLAAQRQMLMEERGLKVNLVGVCGRTKAAFSREGIDPARYKEILAESGKEGGVERMVDEILEMNIFNSVFVDCTASEEVAAQYGRLLSANVSVVAANKVAASSNYDNYEHLKHLARERGVKYLFETNVGAGLPIINTINDLRASGDKILRIEAVLSGTLNFVFNTLSADIPLSKAVQMAKEAGYSEPDPRIDLSGKDVIRKITILARESGYRVEADEIEKNLFIPASLFDGTIDEFWAGLPALDAQFEAERQRLVRENKRWRFVAEWADGKGKVSLREIPLGHPFYDLEGSNNIILLNTERYREYPMLIQGYGAGAAVTAAGVFADVLRVSNI